MHGIAAAMGHGKERLIDRARRAACLLSACVVVGGDGDADHQPGLDPRSVLDHLSGTGGGGDLSGVDEDAFHQVGRQLPHTRCLLLLLLMTRGCAVCAASLLAACQGLLPLNTGLAPDELADLFAYLDTRQTGHVSLDTMVQVLAPPSNTLAGAAEKVQARLKALSSQGVLPLPAFEHVDEDKTGRVTRMQFKEALVDLGFVLVDEPLVAPGGKDDAAAKKKRLGGAGGYVEEEEEAGGVLRPSKDWVWDGGALDKGGAKGRSATLQQKRDEFEKRMQVGRAPGHPGSS